MIDVEKFTKEKVIPPADVTDDLYRDMIRAGLNVKKVSTPILHFDTADKGIAIEVKSFIVENKEELFKELSKAKIVFLREAVEQTLPHKTNLIVRMTWLS